jgi:hypothetical protein
VAALPLCSGVAAIVLMANRTSVILDRNAVKRDRVAFGRAPNRCANYLLSNPCHSYFEI